MPENTEHILTAINGLTEKFGRSDQKLEDLGKFIKGKTNECKDNYKSLKDDFSDIKERLLADDIEEEVSDKLRRRSTDKRRVLFGFIILACTVATAFAAVLGIDHWKSPKSQVAAKDIYTSADASRDRATILGQIHNLAERIKE